MKQKIAVLIILFSVFVNAQQQKKVDFLTAKINITPKPLVKQVKGSVLYTFEVLEKVDSVFLDAQNIDFHKVLLNGKKARYTTNGKTIVLQKHFKKGNTYELLLDYTTKPKQTVYFIDWPESTTASGQIWTQGQGKYTSHWLPSFDDMNEKVEFDLSIIFDANYTVIANGKLKDTSLLDGLKAWNFDMEKPMSSYLLAFAIGKYDKIETTSDSGIPIELYYYPKDSLKTEPTYRYSNRIFNFLENEIGVPYPWSTYKQIPVKDFLYAGMENTTATIFSDAYVIDSIAFMDKNYVNINAHELAHQWFGDMVTEVDGNHHWLHEGFATYFAYLAEKAVFGDDFYYWKLFDTAKQLEKYEVTTGGEALTNPKASSLTFYEKGAWALHALRSRVGADNFKNGVQAYLQKYQYTNVTVDGFLNEVAAVSKTDLSRFKKEWLDSTHFPMDDVKQMLKQNVSVANFYRMQHEISTSKKNRNAIIDRYWASSIVKEHKKHMIQFYSKYLSDSLRHAIITSDELHLRQSILMATVKVTDENEAWMTSFLTDKSYVTVENALYKLWVYRPQNRQRYLEKTKGVMGFNNKNVRQLWLALAVITNDFEPENTESYLNELRSYTSKTHHFETRQLALTYLNDLFAFNENNLLDLANAAMHPSWQFKKFARSILDGLLKKPDYQKKIRQLLPKLSQEERSYITRKLPQ